MNEQWGKQKRKRERLVPLPDYAFFARLYAVSKTFFA